MGKLLALRKGFGAILMQSMVAIKTAGSISQLETSECSINSLVQHVGKATVATHRRLEVKIIAKYMRKIVMCQAF